MRIDRRLTAALPGRGAIRGVVGLLMAAGCAGAPPPAEPGFEPIEVPPRTWDGRDLDAPRRSPAYVPADSASPLPWGPYPGSEDGRARRPGFVRPSADWRAVEELGEPIRLLADSTRVLEGVPARGRRVVIRRSVWPVDGLVLEHDSTQVVLATDWLPVGRLRGELQCGGEVAPRGAWVRLYATVRPTGYGALLAPNVEIEGAEGCEGDERFKDRLRGFIVDLYTAVRAAARSVVPVPLRP